MEENNRYRKSPERPKSRFWHLWGPIIIKIGMAYLVSMAFTAVLMAVYLITEGAVTSDEVNALMSSEQEFAKLYDVMMEQALKYTVYTDGMAALFTIPILLFMFYRDRAKEKVLQVVQNKKAPLWQYSCIVLMAAALCLGFNNLLALSDLAPKDEAYVQVIELMYSAPFIAQIICLGILAPVCEELVFRGLMFRRMRALTSFRYAAFYSSMVFAFIHGNMVQMLYAFLLGMVFSYMYEKYGSVKAPIVAHVTANILSVILTEYQAFDWLLEDTMRISLVTVLCAAIASSMYVVIARIEEQPDIPEHTENNVENNEGSTAE